MTLSRKDFPYHSAVWDEEGPSHYTFILTLHCPACDKRHHRLLTEPWEFAWEPDTPRNRRQIPTDISLDGPITHLDPEDGTICVAHVKQGAWFYSETSTHSAAGEHRSMVPMQYGPDESLSGPFNFGDDGLNGGVLMPEQTEKRACDACLDNYTDDDFDCSDSKEPCGHHCNCTFNISKPCCWCEEMG